MSKNDIARLKEEADIEAVVSYLGIPTVKKGNAYFIRCPQPGHDDKKPTNCYFKPGWSNVYCQACGSSTNAVDLIMYTKGCSYGEAADTLWEIEGRPSWYYKRDQRKKKALFSLTREEADLIGFHMPSRVLCPESMSEIKKDIRRDQAYDQSQLDGYVICKVNHMSITDFLTQRDYESLVLGKTREKIQKFRILKKRYSRKNDVLTVSLYQLADESLQKCEKILHRLNAS